MRIRYYAVLLAFAWAVTLPLQAQILWDLSDAAEPDTVAAGQHIRIGTVSGPWSLMLDYFGRPALCADGYYLEHRTAETAPHGWTQPAIGSDDGGICAAVRDPQPAPAPIEDDPQTLASAFATLANRIDAERQARIAAVVGATEEQIARLARAQTLSARIDAGTATDDDRAEYAQLLQQADHVEQLRLYAETPNSPPMWVESLPPAQTLYGWAEATLGSVAEVDAVDAAAPPVEAPQWPSAEQQ